MAEPIQYHEVPGTVPIRLRSETIVACPHCGAQLGVVIETSAAAVARGPAPETSKRTPQ